jgi:hypothetical protein
MAELPSASASGGSTFAFKYGRRQVKAYPVTEAELREIGTVSRLSTICYSLASGLVGFGALVRPIRRGTAPF